MPFDKQYYLGVAIDGDKELPKTILAGTPYSMFANRIAEDAIVGGEGIKVEKKKDGKLEISGNGTVDRSSKGDLIIDGNITATGKLYSKGDSLGYIDPWMDFVEKKYGNYLLLGSGGKTAIFAGDARSTMKNFYANGRSAHNLNTCLDSSTGKIIKVMFEDDYFLDNDSLKKIAEKYDEGHKWVMNSFTHTQDDKNFFNYITPTLNDHLLDGVNTMGNPSNLSFLRSHKQYFDEDLLYLVDCEYYYRMNLLYGSPGVVDDTLVAIRYHESSATMNPEFISKKDVEINYCANKYYDILES